MSENLKLLGAYSDAMAAGDEKAVFSFFDPAFHSHVADRVNPDVVGTDIRGEELKLEALAVPAPVPDILEGLKASLARLKKPAAGAERSPALMPTTVAR